MSAVPSQTITTAELTELVRRLNPSRADSTRDEWVTIGMAIHDAVPNEAGFSLFDEFSRQSPKYDPKDIRATWKSFKASGGVSLGTLVHLANQDDPHEKRKQQTSKRAYRDLVEYAAEHGTSEEAFIAVGWRETRHDGRRALVFPTTTGSRWRFLDGRKPTYDSPYQYERCLYRLDEAIAIAECTGQPLVLCNGEASTVAAQAHGLAAFAVTGGEKPSIPEPLLAELLGKWRGPIVVAFDCDREGRTAALKVAEQLRAIGYIVRAVDLGGTFGYDIADHCRLHNSSSVQALEALHTLEVLPSEPNPEPTTPANGTPAATRLIPAAELGALPKIAWIIPHMLGRGIISQIFGKPGTGKSLVALDQALTIAQVAPVVYVAGEAVTELDERIKAWCELHGRTAGHLYIWPEAVNLRDDADLDALADAMRQKGAVALVIDPLAECMGAAALDENSARDMLVAVATLRRLIRDAGNPALLLVHHAGWDDTHERGSSALRGACRVVLRLSADDDGKVTLAVQKANNGKPFEERYFTLVSRANSVVLMPRSQVRPQANAPLSPIQVRVLEALNLIQHIDGASHGNVVDATGIAKASVSKAMDVLMRRQLVRKVGRMFSLTTDGSAALRIIASSDTHGAYLLKVADVTFNWLVTMDASDGNSQADGPGAQFTHEPGEVTSDELDEETNKRKGVSPHQDAEFTEFTSNRANRANSSPSAGLNGSPEFTSATASQCGSSPEFTISSPSSSPVSSLVHPLGGPMEAPEVNSDAPVPDRPWGSDDDRAKTARDCAELGFFDMADQVAEPIQDAVFRCSIKQEIAQMRSSSDLNWARVSELLLEGDETRLILLCHAAGRRLDDVKAEAYRRWPELVNRPS